MLLLIIMLKYYRKTTFLKKSGSRVCMFMFRCKTVKQFNSLTIDICSYLGGLEVTHHLKVAASEQPYGQILKTPQNCAAVFCLHPYCRDEKERDALNADPDCALVPCKWPGEEPVNIITECCLVCKPIGKYMYNI